MKRIAFLLAFACATPFLSAQSFTFTDFSTITGLLNLLGSASQQGTVLRLTANASNQTGTAWRSSAFPVAAGFDTTFTFRITPPAVGTKAEGMAFIIQNAPAGTAAVGGTVWGIGYGSGANASPLVNSLAIELDTFQDGFLGDTSSNELTVHTRGTLGNDENEVSSIGRITPATNLSNAQIHTIRILYVPGTLQVFADNLTTPVLTIPYNILSGGTFLNGQPVGGLNLPTGAAFVGFSATTGAGTLTELVEILSWSWTSTSLVDPCYVGNVQDAIGNPIDVLSVDGSTGGFNRRVSIATFQPFTIGVSQPPATTSPSPVILFATLGRPDGSAATALPFGIGSICFPIANPLPVDVVVVTDGFGSGLPAFAGGGICPVSIPVPTGIMATTQFTMQGIIFDQTAPSQLSVTNGLTVDIVQAPAPTITNLSPSSAAAGATITITGTNFRSGLTLTVAGTPVTPTTITPTTITFPYPAGTPCASTAVVTNLDGQTASRAINPQPTVNSTINSSGPAAGGANFIITGTGFAPGTTVTIGGNAANVTTATASVLIMTTPPGTTGPKTVVVTTPGGCTVMTTYTYL